MPNGHQNWQSLGAGGMYGGATSYGGGGYGDFPVARDRLDALRMGIGRTPEAEYPDGYLGPIRTRREDRVLDTLKAREGQRAYQRGVHKGERIDPSDYFYPPQLRPDRGLVAQSKGLRQAPKLQLVPAPHLVNDGKVDVPNNVTGTIDLKRVAQFGHLVPQWT